MVLLLEILFQDAAQSLMNHDEAYTLAHPPIRGATYVAAKLTHLLGVHYFMQGFLKKGGSKQALE